MDDSRHLTGINPFMALICASMAVGLLAWEFAFHRVFSGATVDLVPEPAIVDLGDIPEGVYPGSIGLVNVSQQSIALKAIYANCRCASTSLTRQHIHPDQPGKALYEWDVRGLEGPASSIISIAYRNDTSESEKIASFELRANVLPDFTVDPQHLTFNRTETHGTILFHPKQFKSLQLLDARCVHPAFRVTLRQAERLIEVSYDPARWLDHHGTVDLIVATNSHNQPERRVKLVVIN